MDDQQTSTVPVRHPWVQILKKHCAVVKHWRHLRRRFRTGEMEWLPNCQVSPWRGPYNYSSSVTLFGGTRLFTLKTKWFKVNSDTWLVVFFGLDYDVLRATFYCMCPSTECILEGFIRDCTHTNTHTDTNATAHLHFALLRSALHISLLGASHENWPWARECLGNIIYNIYVYMFTYIYSIALCLWARSRAFAAWLFVSSARAGLVSSADWNLQPSPVWWWFLAPLVPDCGSSDQILSCTRSNTWWELRQLIHSGLGSGWIWPQVSWRMWLSNTIMHLTVKMLSIYETIVSDLTPRGASARFHGPSESHY